MFRPGLPALTAAALCTAFSSAAIGETATGIVFHDANGNEVYDEGERGLPGVRVSNGRDVVLTDGEGRYAVEVDNDDIIFVIKPRGFRTPLSPHMLPEFYYIHKPEGSPANLRYPGVEPTGPLPESVDFPLYPQDEPDVFRAIMFADPQPRNMEEVQYVAHDVVEELAAGTDASFGVSLGDVMFDDLTLFEAQNAAIATIGIPWYNVIGNHDINFDVPNDDLSDETWNRIFGPAYYSYDYGPVHFIVLDDVDWLGWDDEKKTGNYRGGIGEEQMEFLRNNLALVPEDKLVVLMMHIPIVQAHDREELFRLIEQRPYTMSVSGHTHYQEHLFLTEEDGWRGPKPHHHVINVTVSGSWWGGAPDETGVPHTTMRDGAPNGYSVVTFDGADYTFDFKAARRPADYQMNIYAPERITSSAAADTDILVNVFAGSEKSETRMRLNEGDWVTMERMNMKDPAIERINEREVTTPPTDYRKLSNARVTPHIWRAALPANPPAGTHLITVQSTDMWGRTHEDQRIIVVE